MMNSRALYWGSIVAALLTLIVVNTGNVRAFMELVKSPHPSVWDQPAVAAWAPAGDSGAAGAPASLKEKERRLWQRIAEEAERTRIPPVDAKIDRVWKAIPGYNGREIDVRQTFELARKLPEDAPIPYVYRELKPKVSLEDLEPHPIYRGNPNKPMVALMINVAWGNEYIPVILDILRKEQVKATFFFDGSWLSKHIDIAKQIQADGHELSNHAYSHKNMSTLSREEAVREIVRTQQLLKERLGVDNQLFAPPSGDFNETTVKIARELKLKTVLWTIDTVDWKNPPPDSVVRKISKRLEPGAMILMHPTPSTSLSLTGIIQAIREKGYVTGTVSELLSPERVPETKSF